MGIFEMGWEKPSPVQVNNAVRTKGPLVYVKGAWFVSILGCLTIYPLAFLMNQHDEMNCKCFVTSVFQIWNQNDLAFHFRWILDPSCSLQQYGLKGLSPT